MPEGHLPEVEVWLWTRLCWGLQTEQSWPSMASGSNNNLNQAGSISSLSTSCFWARPAVSWNPSEKQGETVGGRRTCTSSPSKNFSWGQFEGPMGGMCCLRNCGNGRTQPGSSWCSWWMRFHESQHINFHRHSLSETTHYPMVKLWQIPFLDFRWSSGDFYWGKATLSSAEWYASVVWRSFVALPKL